MDPEKETYYVQVANFVLKFIFHNSSFVLHRAKFIENCLLNFKNFLITKRKQDITIHFVDFKEGNFFYWEDSATYIKSCQKIDNKNIEIYYHVSLGELNILWKDIFQDLLAKSNGILLHASACCIDSKAYVFLGTQGAGKSTVIQLLKDVCVPLGDDSVFIIKEDNKYKVHQTPFLDTHYMEKNSKSYPLGGLFILEKSQSCWFEPMRKNNQILPLLLKQVITKKNTFQIK